MSTKNTTRTSARTRAKRGGTSRNGRAKTPAKEKGQELERSNGQPPVPRTMDPIKLGEVLAASGYFQDARDAAQAAVKVMAGQELGFGPIASMTGVHIIDGKPSIGAALLAALVKNSPNYTYKIAELNDERCSIEFYEDGELLNPPSEFSMEDAKRAGLTNKHNWRHYPRNMLFARALSNGITFHCPELAGGSPIYLPEELGAEVDGATGAVIAAPAAPAAPATVAKPTVARPTAAAPQQTQTLATPAQRRLVMAKAKEAELDEPALKAILDGVGGNPHLDRLPKAKVDVVLDEIKKASGGGES